MRTFVAATLVATLIATSALAAATVSPLPSGKPAGVKKAMVDDNTLMYGVGLGAIAFGVILIASGNGDSTAATTTTK